MTSPTLPEVLVVPTDEVPRAAAAHIAGVLAGAVDERGIAHWATTGGSSAPGIYAALASPPLAGEVPWRAVHTWFGDDRFVPDDHPESNVRPLISGLLAGAATDRPGRPGVVIAADHLHRWPIAEAIARRTGPAGAAAGYAAMLASLVPPDADGTPVLDLIILGVGPDGHILSVFPGSAAWDSGGTCVAVPAPTHIGPHLDRVTFHPRLLRAARAVLVLTTGESKAPRVAHAWTGDDARELPLRAARLATATWILDEAAAAGLPRAGG
jgi:6-phosphogluconolactonase